MTRFFILCLSIFLVGCNDTAEEPESPNQSMEISVNNETIKIFDEEFGANENCDNIYVSASVYKKFMVELGLTKEGFIKDVLLVDYSNSDNNHYRTADFKPSETFSIQNYFYDEGTKHVTFNFSGTLYDDTNEDNTILIDGKINLSNLKTIDCSYEPWSMKADLNDNYFSCPIIVGKGYSDRTEWWGFSDSGIKLTIITSQELSDMPIGKYAFTQADIQNIVTIENYIGQSKASAIKLFNGSEWENYQCEGELIIEEHIEGAKPHTKGSFTIHAFKNGELVYEVENGKFSI